MYLFNYFDEKSISRCFFFGTCMLTIIYLIHDQLPKSFIQTNSLIQNNVSFKMVCYYNFPENESQLQPELIPEHLCTHIILAFAGINVTDYSIKIPVNGSQIIPRLCSLKLKNRSLQIMISVGGAGYNGFSDMVKTHANRKMFINSTMRFLKTYKLDGVDIDWEWPTNDGNPKEKVKFIQLLQEFRDEFDRHKKIYLLTIAAGALRSEVTIFYYVNYIAKYVNFVNLMTYDYHFYTPYYPITDYNAPLFASAKDKNSIFSDLNINYSVNFWISQSMPRNKIILGLPAFGHTYTLMSSLNHELHSPARGFGSLGTNGFINYNELCKFLKLLNTFHVRDNDAKVPYAYNQYEWISYDDEESIQLKAEYIVQEELGGAMVYSLNSEDYAGVCGSNIFPLVNKAQAVFKMHGTAAC